MQKISILIVLWAKCFHNSYSCYVNWITVLWILILGFFPKNHVSVLTYQNSLIILWEYWCRILSNSVKSKKKHIHKIYKKYHFFISNKIMSRITTGNGIGRVYKHTQSNLSYTPPNTTSVMTHYLLYTNPHVTTSGSSDSLDIIIRTKSANKLDNSLNINKNTLFGTTRKKSHSNWSNF